MRLSRLPNVFVVILGLALPLIGAMADSPQQSRGSFTPEQRAYWALQKVAQPNAPTVHDSGWVRNPVDAFILAQLEAKNLRPSPPADRRLSYAE